MYTDILTWIMLKILNFTILFVFSSPKLETSYKYISRCVLTKTKIQCSFAAYLASVSPGILTALFPA